MRLTRYCLHAAVLPLLLMLAACQPSIEKADAYEAQYDHMMAVQAYPAALVSIQKSIAQDDSTSRRYIKLAEVQMAMGRPAAAAGAYQSALDLEPSNVEALQNLAILSVRGGQFDMAKRYIEPLLALSADDPAGLLASGAIALAQKRFRDADKLGDHIITVMADRPDGYILKARALDGLGRVHEAIDMLEKRAMTTTDPKDYLFQLMTFYRKLGDIKNIRATAIRMMPLDPDNTSYAFESARAYAAEGDKEKVDEIIDDLLRRFGRNTDVLIAIGNFWRDTQPLPIAQAEITKLAAASPPRLRTALADQLIGMGDAQDALKLLASLAPPQVTGANIDSQTHYARALLVTGQTAQAQAKVDAVLAYDGGNPEALLVRARLKLLARDYRGAFTDAQVVTNDDESNEEAALLVAQIYTAQGNQVLAGSAYGSARQKFPESIRALQAEIDWLLSQKRNEEASQRAVAFYHSHLRDQAAIKIAHDTCAKTHANACGVGVSNVAKMLGM